MSKTRLDPDELHELAALSGGTVTDLVRKVYPDHPAPEKLAYQWSQRGIGPRLYPKIIDAIKMQRDTLTTWLRRLPGR